MKILLADNSSFMRGILKGILKNGGYADAQILEVEDGEAAVSQYNLEKPDLLLLDIIMPKKDGIAVLKEIGVSAPAIVVSAVGQQTLIDEALKLGAKGFIIKPFDAKQVIETIQNVIVPKQA